MAHIDTQIYQTDAVDRAPLRVAPSWHALAVTTAAMWIVPALVVGTLFLIEAAIPQVRPEMAGRSRVAPQPERSHASVQRPTKLSTACVQAEPVRCVTD